jgi:Tol biopolymer transport system component
MRFILILFLILFMIVSSLFIITLFGNRGPSPEDTTLSEEEPLPEEAAAAGEIQADTALKTEEAEVPGLEENTADDGYLPAGEDKSAVVQYIEEGPVSGTDKEAGDGRITGPDAGEEEPVHDTIKIFLDGDMENGIYLGTASCGEESSMALEQYGPGLADTGFIFEWKNTDLEMEPGSTHFIYIYYYNTQSGWDHIRKEINITGEKPGDKNIKVFIDKPSGQAAIEKLTGIIGWAVNTSSTEDTGIGKVEIYIDGPRGSGRKIGDADYGIPRSGVSDLFKNQNYLYSGFELDTEVTGLEPGSKHTIFVYAESSNDPVSYNFEKTDIYISGTANKKAVIEAVIDLQRLSSDNTLYVEGYAVESSGLEEFLQQQKDESVADNNIAGDSSFSGTEANSIEKLVFKSNRDGNDNIYSINTDGTGLKRLTDYKGADLYPEVSPDGKKIAYTSDIGGIWQIMVMDRDGQNKRQITNNSFRSAYPSWSHDMKYIYFEAYLDGDWELYRIGSNGAGQKRLTHNSSGHDWHPSGHPFDYKIIFESGMPGHDDIYMMNSDGSSISRIFKKHERRRTPDLSSDSTKITYTRYFGDNSEVYYADIRDQDEKRITYNQDWDGHPMFSPDGKFIVYEQRTGGKEDIIIYNIETGIKTNVTNSIYYDSDACFMYQK